MILGVSAATFTLLHVLISLVAIGSGLVLMYGLLNARRMDCLTAVFLTTTALTSLTGFFFPDEHITPAVVVGIRSVFVLVIAATARFAFHLGGIWRPTYVITAAIALYFNVFVFAVKAFEKVPALRALAPTQKEPPFGITQLLALILFVVATVYAVRRFRPSFSSGAEAISWKHAV